MRDGSRDPCVHCGGQGVCDGMLMDESVICWLGTGSAGLRSRFGKSMESEAMGCERQVLDELVSTMVVLSVCGCDANGFAKCPHIYHRVWRCICWKGGNATWVPSLAVRTVGVPSETLTRYKGRIARQHQIEPSQRKLLRQVTISLKHDRIANSIPTVHPANIDGPRLSLPTPVSRLVHPKAYTLPQAEITSHLVRPCSPLFHIPPATKP